MKHASVILLERLLDGLPIKHNGYDMTLERTKKDNKPMTCVMARRSILGKKYWEEVPIGYPITLQDFIQTAEKMTEEELIIISGETVLNKINRKKRN